jgi:hypothetical protein
LRLGLAIDLHPGAYATPIPGVRRLHVTQTLQTSLAHSAQSQGVLRQVGDDRHGAALIGRRALAQGPLPPALGHPILAQIAWHRRGAGTPARALQGVGQLCLEAAWRTVFQQHPAKRRQRPPREAGADGRKLLTQSPGEPRWSRGHGGGVEPLGQRLRGHRGVRRQIAQAVAATFPGHRRLFDHCRRPQLDAILAGQCAARSLEKLAVARQGFSGLGIEYRGEFPFDLAGLAVHLLFHLPRRLSEKQSVQPIESELPSGRWQAIISAFLDKAVSYCRVGSDDE